MEFFIKATILEIIKDDNETLVKLRDATGNLIEISLPNNLIRGQVFEISKLGNILQVSEYKLPNEQTKLLL